LIETEAEVKGEEEEVREEEERKSEKPSKKFRDFDLREKGTLRTPSSSTSVFSRLVRLFILIAHDSKRVKRPYSSSKSLSFPSLRT